MTSVALCDLLARCDAYSEAAGLSRSRVSTLVLNDGKRLQALKDGADITTRRLEAAHGVAGLRRLLDLGLAPSVALAILGAGAFSGIGSQSSTDQPGV